MDDTAAGELIQDFVEATNGPVNGTNGQKVRWFFNHLIHYAKDTANNLYVNKAVTSASTTAAATVASRDWGADV